MKLGFLYNYILGGIAGEPFKKIIISNSGVVSDQYIIIMIKKIV